FIQGWLKEPEKWKQMVAAGGKRGGSYGELLGEARWRNPALFGLLLALAGVIGLWGIGFFSFDLVRYVMDARLGQEAKDLGLTGADVANYVKGQKTFWSGITSLVQNVGAFFGIFAFSWVSAYMGRKPAFAMFFVLAGASTAVVFLFLDS